VRNTLRTVVAVCQDAGGQDQRGPTQLDGEVERREVGVGPQGTLSVGYRRDDSAAPNGYDMFRPAHMGPVDKKGGR